MWNSSLLEAGKMTWDGDLYANSFHGDGSQLTGITGGGAETDPIWSAASGAWVGPHVVDATIHFASAALWADINSNSTKISYTDATLVAANVASTALNSAKISYTDAALLAANVASTAINSAKVTYDDAVLVAANVASTAINSAKVSYTDATLVAANTASTALNTTHRGDTTDPHGATLSNTAIIITGDNTTASTALVRNIVLGTDATPPSAALFTTGTLYVQYTA